MRNSQGSTFLTFSDILQIVLYQFISIQSLALRIWFVSFSNTFLSVYQMFLRQKFSHLHNYSWITPPHSCMQLFFYYSFTTFYSGVCPSKFVCLHFEVITRQIQYACKSNILSLAQFPVEHLPYAVEYLLELIASVYYMNYITWLYVSFYHSQLLSSTNPLSLSLYIYIYIYIHIFH